jgi:RNase P/RNase MRP subunit p29
MAVMLVGWAAWGGGIAKIRESICESCEVAGAGRGTGGWDFAGRAGKVARMTEQELKIEDLREGTGEVAKAGQTVGVHYVGTLIDGKKFDSSRDRGQPFKFRLGAGEVIQGWDRGVAGMKVGGLRKLTIPSDLGYGDAGYPGGDPAEGDAGVRGGAAVAALATRGLTCCGSCLL